jgi:hypothetical protein
LSMNNRQRHLNSTELMNSQQAPTSRILPLIGKVLPYLDDEPTSDLCMPSTLAKVLYLPTDPHYLLRFIRTVVKLKDNTGLLKCYYLNVTCDIEKGGNECYVLAELSLRYSNTSMTRLRNMNQDLI